MEPDEFQINLDGIQASFYITGYDSRTGQCTVRIKSRQPYDFSVKVFLSNTGGNHINDQIPALLFQYISKIIVTDSDGVRYIFGGDGNDLSSIEFSIKPCSTYRYGMASASTWNLTRIEYPNNETITFRYRKDGRPIVRTILREGRGLNYKIDGDNYGNYLLDSSLPPSSTGSWYNYYINNDLYSQRDDSPYIKLMYLSPSYLSSVRSKASGDSVVFHISRSIELKDLGTDTDPTYEDAAELFRTNPVSVTTMRTSTLRTSSPITTICVWTASPKARREYCSLTATTPMSACPSPPSVLWPEQMMVASTH